MKKQATMFGSTRKGRAKHTDPALTRAIVDQFNADPNSVNLSHRTTTKADTSAPLFACLEHINQTTLF
jgi:hypothetical protein